MSVFEKEYAAYYDMLYKNKNYDAESDYVADLLHEAGITGGELLDVGCGTGKHLACMRNKGFSVSGVDLSQSMIQKARQTLGDGIALQVADAASFSFSKKFDAITSLFHVVSYLTDTDDVVSAFKNIAVHLTRGGAICLRLLARSGLSHRFSKDKNLAA